MVRIILTYLGRNIFFWLFFLVQCSYAQQKHLLFDRINNDDGLSQNTVSKVVQDHLGFLWIATQDGLNRFDGYKFEIFQSNSYGTSSLSHNIIEDMAVTEDGKKIWLATLQGVDIFDTESLTVSRFENLDGMNYQLPDNTVNCVYLDSKLRMWIGTIEGLAIYDFNTKSFQTFKYSASDPLSLSDNDVNVVYEDLLGTIWVGTMNGLNKVINVDSDALVVERFAKEKLSSAEINDVFEDSNNNIWIGTENGLNVFDRQSNNVIEIKHDSNNSHSITDDRIISIYQDSKESIWIATKNGLNLLIDFSNKSFDHYYNDGGNPYSLSNNWVSSIFEDRGGVLWVGTYFGGLNKLRLYGKEFYIYRNNPYDNNSITSNVIRSIVKDSKSNTLWVGANPGLNRIDLTTGNITRILPTNKPGKSLNNEIVRSLFIDRKGQLLIGTGRGGLNLYNPKTDSYRYITQDTINDSGFRGRDIRTVIEDSRGIIWAGSIDQGLNRIDPNTGEIKNYIPIDDDPFSIGSKFIYHVKEDITGNLWIATYDGLDYYARNADRFYHFKKIDNDSTSIPDNYVKCILITKKGDLWIGTAGGGIAKLIDMKNGIFKTYDTENGIANDFIYGILEDDDENLWMSTNRGIAKFITSEERFINFEKIDGIQGNEFNSGAFYKSEEGEMFFGGINGLTYFNPNEIKLNEAIPNVVVTDIQIFNESIFSDPKSEYHSFGIKYKKDNVLDLSFRENVISFEFASLDFTSPGKNRYAYKMEGFDKDWIEVDATKRFATYTNLPHGTYTFLVNGSNNDELWSAKPFTILINIEPPFYKEKWFLVMCILLGSFLTIAVHKTRVAMLKKQKKFLSEEVKKQTAEIQAKNMQLENRQAEILTQNDQLERQARKLENAYENVRVLSDIGHEITSILKLEDILDRVYRRANILMHATEFGIGLYNDDKKTITYTLYNINGDKKENIEFSIESERFSCWSIKNKESVWIGNIRKNYREHIANLKEYENNESMKSLIIIPMILGDKVIGLVSVQSDEEDAYSKYHFDILSTLTSYITVAIDNARTYQLLEQKVDERTADLKSAYEELITANANFDQFTYRSAHDLRGPLARILGLCYLGKMETKEPKGLEYLEHLEKVANEMDQMLSRLLRTHNNKAREIYLEDVNVKEITENVMKKILEKRSIDWVNLNLNISKDLKFMTDEFMFSILIENILDNAVQFQDFSKRENFVDVYAEINEHNHLKMTITDNGIGISREFQDRIFEMFFVGSDKTKGSGLGLYESAIIAEKLGGRVRLISSDKVKTTFEIIL